MGIETSYRRSMLWPRHGAATYRQAAEERALCAWNKHLVQHLALQLSYNTAQHNLSITFYCMFSGKFHLCSSIISTSHSVHQSMQPLARLVCGDRGLQTAPREVEAWPVLSQTPHSELDTPQLTYPGKHPASGHVCDTDVHNTQRCRQTDGQTDRQTTHAVIMCSCAIR